MARNDQVLGVVRVSQLLAHLRNHPEQWPAALIAERAGLPRSIVYDALNGENVTMRTLTKIAKVCGGEVVVMMKKGMSKLTP